MAVPRVYKAITAHQRLCEFADWFMKTHRQELGDALAEVFGKDIAEGEPVPDVLPLVDALLLRLRRALEVLVEAEKVHLDELADDAGYRKLRDEAVAALRAILIDVRGLFRSAFGPEKAQEVGFEREIAQDPLALLRQTARLLDHLRRPDLELPPSQYEGLTVTPALIAAQIEPGFAALREAVDHVTREEGEAQGTQVAKDKALEAFRQTYLLFLRILQAAFRLGGKPELASRLRRSLRRSGPTPGDGETGGEPDSPTVPPDTKPDEPGDGAQV